MNRSETRGMDRVLLLTVLALLVLGTGVIYSASSFWSAERHNDYSLYFKRHLLRVALSLALLAVASRIDYRRYRELTPLLSLVVCSLLVAVFFNPPINHVHRTIALFKVRFQPAESMKLMVVLYMAAVLAREDLRLSAPFFEGPIFYHFLYLAVSTALVALEPDMGTATVVFALGMAMFVLGGIPKRYLAAMAALVIPAAGASLALNPYQWHRLKVFVSSQIDGGALPYQIHHSLIAFSRGGVFGVGFGEGHQKNLFLPQPFSDFVLASLGEELGYVGLAVLFGLVTVLLWRGVRIALRARDQYGFLLAGGVTSLILINVLINAGVVLYLLPTTGLPFPFLSYGGSSLFVVAAGIGILLNVSQYPRATFSDFPGRRHPMDFGVEP